MQAEALTLRPGLESALGPLPASLSLRVAELVIENGEFEVRSYSSVL